MRRKRLLKLRFSGSRKKNRVAGRHEQHRLVPLIPVGGVSYATLDPHPYPLLLLEGGDQSGIGGRLMLGGDITGGANDAQVFGYDDVM